MIPPEEMELYKVHAERIRKAKYKLTMLNQYMGWIRNKYDKRTIFEALEAAGFDIPICDAIHKLLYYDVDDPDILNLLTEDGVIVTHCILTHKETVS